MPVYQDKGGRWMFKCCIHGHQFLRRGFSSSDEASRQELMFKATFGSDKVYVPRFNELCEMFLSREKMLVKETTYLHDRHRIEEHILGQIPDQPVDELSYGDFLAWRNHIESSHLMECNIFVSLLNRIFDFCFDVFGIKVKFVKLIPPFRDYSYGPQRIKDKVKILSESDLRSFINACDDDEFRLLFITGFITGMRIGEARGLQVKCFDGNKLFVYQQVNSKLEKGKSKLMSTKSSDSNRVYYLPSFLSSSLLEYIKFHHLVGNDFLFPSSYSNQDPLGETTINRYMKETCAKAGINKIHFHMFRHTEASLLNDSGLDRKTIAAWLGHSSEKITEQYYIHDSSDKKEQLASYLNDRFSSLLPSSFQSEDGEGNKKGRP
jgi:integrase